MRAQTAKLYSWALQKANSTKAPLWVGILFFLELILFIPLDAILIFFCLQDRKKTFFYVAIAALMSTLSGLIGYFLGYGLWDLIGSTIVPHLISTNSFNHLTLHFQLHENLAVFLTSLVPFPLKALSVTAGVFHLSIAPFLTFLFLARLLRFSLIGVSMVVWGEKVKNFVDRYFHQIFMLIGAKVAAILLLFWALTRA